MSKENQTNEPKTNKDEAISDRAKTFAPLQKVFDAVKAHYLAYDSFSLEDAAKMFQTNLAEAVKPEETSKDEETMNRITKKHGGVTTKLLSKENNDGRS